jgi:hypothetical protein
VIYSINQATWQGIELVLWKYLASTDKVHAWMFCVDLLGNLAEKGVLYVAKYFFSDHNFIDRTGEFNR